MPYKNVQDIMSDDDDDDELFSYLQTAHTVKYSKIEPIKACDDVIVSCTKSDMKSDELDKHRMSGPYKDNHRQSRKSVSRKRNGKHGKQSKRTLLDQRKNKEMIPEECEMDNSSYDIKDISNDIQCSNNKETNVDEFEIFNARNTDLKQNVVVNRSPEIHADVKKQTSFETKDLTEQCEHYTDREAVVTSIGTPEKGNKTSNSYRSDMSKCESEHERCQTEVSSLDSKYYLINERDWMALFSSLPMNKQEYPLLGLSLPNPQICSEISDHKNKDVCNNVTDTIPGQESSADTSDIKEVVSEAAVNETPVKQTMQTGPQNVEVVYVRIEDEKLKCDINNSPVKNVMVRSPRKYRDKSNCSKHSEVVQNCDNSTAMAEVRASTVDRYSEDDFHVRFVRINNKLTRVLHLKDQSDTDKIQTHTDELVEENTLGVDDHSEDQHNETAFFIDLDNWNETHGESDSDLKIYPISIQDDSYTFLQENSDVEQYIARPLIHDEDCTIVDEPTSELNELANSYTLHMNQSLQICQGSHHSDKVISDKSPLKTITLSPCKLVRSPEKSRSQIKTEVMNSSSEIITNLWKNTNLESNHGLRMLPGAVSSSENVVENSVNVSLSPSRKEAESDSGSDNENDMLLRYLKRSKIKSVADTSSTVNFYDENSSQNECSDKFECNNGSSVFVQTSVRNNDNKFESNEHVSKCMGSEMKKREKTSEIHKCSDAIHEELQTDEDSDKSKTKCSDKKRLKRDVNSKSDIRSPPENKPGKAVDNIGNLDCAKKKVRRKSSVSLSEGKGKIERSDTRKRKRRYGKANVKKAKHMMTEMSSSFNDERTRACLEGSKRVKASKQPSQSKNKVNKKSLVLKDISKNTVKAVSEIPKRKKEFGNGMSVSGSVCNELDKSEGMRSEENHSAACTSSHFLLTSCDSKNSGNEKKQLKTGKEESKKCNEYDEKTSDFDKDCADVSVKSKVKRTNRTSGGCKLKKKKVVTDVSKGQKSLNSNGRSSKKVGKNDSDGKPFKVNNDKKVERKIKGKKAVKSKRGVVCPSTEMEDLNKWSKIKNSKVEFLEHLFRIKLKEAVQPKEKLPDQVACTENIFVENSGNQENLEKDCNFDTQIKCAEKSIGKVAQREGHTDDVEINEIDNPTEPSTNINAAKSENSIKTNRDSLISQQANNVLHGTDDNLSMFEPFELDLIQRKVNMVEKEPEFQSDTEKIPTKKMKCDNLLQVTGSVDANVSCSHSEIGSGTGWKKKHSKKKNIQMQLINTSQDSCKRKCSKISHKKINELNAVPESGRRHQRIKSLKQLQSRSKTVYKRKTEIWKEQLQDEAFKFNFDEDLHKTYRPLNVKEMIRKILKPLSGGSEGRKNAKDRKRHRKGKVSRMASKVSVHTSRHRVISECDDAWFSDSGPSDTFPAFKFTTDGSTNHEVHTPVHTCINEETSEY